jgi:hypothetical protein
MHSIYPRSLAFMRVHGALQGRLFTNKPLFQCAFKMIFTLNLITYGEPDQLSVS